VRRSDTCRNGLYLESPSSGFENDGDSPWQRKCRALLVEPGQDKHPPTCVAYCFPCTVCKSSSALLKVSVLEFLT
jgi:hypothetical protein